MQVRSPTMESISILKRHKDSAVASSNDKNTHSWALLVVCQLDLGAPGRQQVAINLVSQLYW